MNQLGSGILQVSGVEVRYLTPSDLKMTRGLKYVDTFELLPMLQRLCFNPVTRTFDPPNILLTGAKGNGKSLLFAYLAEQNQLPYLSLDCSEETKERHLKGGFVAKNGSTPFVLGTVSNAIQVANEVGAAMLVFEELNALSPQRQKELNALTDFRKKIEIPELSWRLELNPGCKLFVTGTMNPSGPYGGTYELNEDLKSRFIEIDMPYPPPGAEKRILQEMSPEGVVIPDEILQNLIAIARETRQEATAYSLSPRDLVQLLHVYSRLGWEDTLFLVGQKFSSEDRALVLKRIEDITRMSVSTNLHLRRRPV
jgi:hypothetical protein